MSRILFFDTETSGLPNWKEPSDSPSQPHLVQLGALLADEETREVVSSLDLVIRPDGWEISDETIEIHGITNEKAKTFGVDEEMALAMFMALWDEAPRVAHNRTFDQRMIRIALKRYADQEAMDAWAEKDTFDDTMLIAKPIMQLGPKGRYGYKPPKLTEAYEHFVGKPLEQTHQAIDDARACMELYWAILDYQRNAA